MELNGIDISSRKDDLVVSAMGTCDFVIDAFRPCVGKAIPFLDWEADALDLGASRAKRWLERVKAKTGVTPGILKDFCWRVPDDLYDLGEGLLLLRVPWLGYPDQTRRVIQSDISTNAEQSPRDRELR